jgi:nitrogen regulatory protein PII
VKRFGFHRASASLYWREERRDVKLVVFVLNREELIEHVLEAYVEAGITGATILDSEGMGRFLTYEVPLFADFKQFMKGNKPYNKTILSVVSDEAAIPRLRALLDEVTGGLSQPGTGILFTVPIDDAFGLVEQQLDTTEVPDE